MKRKFYFSIIPTQPSGKKNPLFFILLFFLLSVFLTISLILLVRLFSSNNGVLVRRTDVKKVQNENIILKKTERELTESYEITQTKLNELEKTTKRITPLLDIQKLPEDTELAFSNLTITNRLDTLLAISERNRTIFSYAFKKLMNNKKLSSSIPSINPVDGYMIKGYGYISDLFTDEIRFHPGVTFSAMKGSPVYATGDGSIIRTGMENGIGVFVQVNHDYGYITKYGHLQSVRVEEGEYVKRGDVIGYVGKTGRTTGPCLYYEIIMGGKKTNPLYFIFEDIETLEP